MDPNGAAYFDKDPVGANELVQRLAACHRTNENVRVFISREELESDDR